MNAVDEESPAGAGIATPPRLSPQSTSPARSYELLAEGLLGGFLSRGQHTSQSVSKDSSSSSLAKRFCRNVGEREPEDIWLALDKEEHLEKDW
jgi:hypothetical protein